MTKCHWPRFPTLVTLSWFYIKPSSNVWFSEAVIAESVQPCIVIVFDIFFKLALWPSALDLDFALEWLCCDFMSSQALKWFTWNVKTYFLWKIKKIQCHLLQILLSTLMKYWCTYLTRSFRNPDLGPSWTSCLVDLLTLVTLNKLRCHVHF